MIKMRELSIGNKVRCNRLKDAVVTIQGMKGYDIFVEFENEKVKMSSLRCEEKDLDPIPLNKEMLNNSGFHNCDHYNGDVHYTIFGIDGVFENNSQILTMYPYSGLGDPESYGYEVKIEFVHKLQNLIYSLTDNELEIKL
jgi:hypothetical protein